MNRIAILAILATAVTAAPAPAAERNLSVTSFDRVRIDGPYRVTLKTGVAPFARVVGPQAGLDQVSIDVQGRTLVVRAQRQGWGSNAGGPPEPVEIMIGTHQIGTAWINGTGSLSIDRVEGLGFDLTIQGSGLAEIGDTSVDQLTVGISGAGTARLAGRAPKLKAIVRGTSVLDAGRLQVKDAVIGAEGPSQVRMSVSNAAEVDAVGISSVELSGSPACTVRAKGSAIVRGCGSASSR